MSNPVWRGTLRYGATELGIKIYSGPRAENISFRQIDSHDATALRQVMVRADGKPPRGAIVKGYAAGEGFVPFTDAEIASAHPAPPKVLNLVAFRPPLDSVLVESSYFLAPDGESEAAYAALYGSLSHAGLQGCGKIMISTRERPAIVFPHVSGLVLQTLFYEREWKTLDEFRTNLALAPKTPEPLKAGRLPTDFFIDVQHAHLAQLVQSKSAKRSGAKRRKGE